MMTGKFQIYDGDTRDHGQLGELLNDLLDWQLDPSSAALYQSIDCDRTEEPSGLRQRREEYLQVFECPRWYCWAVDDLSKEVRSNEKMP